MLFRIEKLMLLSTLASCLVLLCSAAFGQESGAAGKGSEVVLKVGERTVTESDLAVYDAMRGRNMRQRQDSEARARMLDLMAERILFAEEARAVGLDRDPQVRLLIQDTVDKILANLYVNRHLFPRVEVSESEIRDYHNDHKPAFRRPETVRAAHILLRVPSETKAEEIQATEARASEIRRRLAAGESFEKLAFEFSEDTGTRDAAGDLGFFDRNGKVKALSDAAFALEPGEISEPVRSSVGIHILKVTDRRPPGTKALDEVRGRIRSMLLRKKKIEAAREARHRLEEKFGFYIHEAYAGKEDSRAK